MKEHAADIVGQCRVLGLSLPFGCADRHGTPTFVGVLVALRVRSDLVGVTSVVLAHGLTAVCYHRLLYFFHSPALDVAQLIRVWTRLAVERPFARHLLRCPGCLVLLADGLKTSRRVNECRKSNRLINFPRQSEAARLPLRLSDVARPDYCRRLAMHYLACDLGAESGRLMAGSLTDGKITLEDVHRFPNTPIAAGASLHWDIPRLWAELQTGLAKAARLGRRFESISTDSWGVDYLLFNAAGEVIAPTFHYRDPRTAQGVARVQARVDWKSIFAETGIQFMPLNTLFQLGAESPERWAQAHQWLLVGDGFNFLLSGVARAEESMASTSQLYNPRTRTWSPRLLEAVDLPTRLLPPIVPSGTRLGPLRESVAQAIGLQSVEVIATCSHDTGAAVAAVPAEGDDWAYLSSGTWSLIGLELPSPVITDTCRELNFTNEIGFGGSVRLLKNIVGLWLMQECRRAWAAAGDERDYAVWTQLAAAAPPTVSLIHPADPRFVSPGDMPGKIAAFCRETDQPVPATPGATLRCALESLALLYARTLRQMESLTGRAVRRLHIVGGGSQNALLNQLTANALQRPVWAGPVEATALGNILVQSIALGHRASLDEARRCVRESCALRRFDPMDAAAWSRLTERFDRLFAP